MKKYKSYSALYPVPEGLTEWEGKQHDKKYAPYWWKKLYMCGLFYYQKPNKTAHFRDMAFRFIRMKKGVSSLNCKITYSPGIFSQESELIAYLFALRAKEKGIGLHSSTISALERRYGDGAYIFFNSKIHRLDGNPLRRQILNLFNDYVACERMMKR